MVTEFYPHERTTLLRDRRVTALAGYLAEDERVEAVIFGRFSALVSPRCSLWATDRQLILVTVMLGAVGVTTYPYSKVHKLTHSGSFLGDAIQVGVTGDQDSTIAFIEKSAARKFLACVQRKIHRGTAAPEGERREHTANLAEQLERLGALRADGLLTEDEFQSAKRKPLG